MREDENTLMNARQCLRFLGWSHIKPQTLYLRAKKNKVPYHLSTVAERNKYLFKPKEIKEFFALKEISAAVQIPCKPRGRHAMASRIADENPDFNESDLGFDIE